MKTKLLSSARAGIKTAAKQLRAGKLVAFPTETVYGLGANAYMNNAVAHIFEAKNRPSFNPLIVHFGSVEDVKSQVFWNERSEMLARAFWPGALTIVLNKNQNCQLSQLISAGLNTIAVRVPDHNVAQNLIKEAACPIAAPSANLSGKTSPTNAEHVHASLNGKIPYIVNGGNCKIGVESTVVDLSGKTPVILRPGGVTREQLNKTIGPVSVFDEDAEILSPGMLKRHYAPNTHIRINATDFLSNENVIGFGPNAPISALNLSPTEDLIEAAANLFGIMHKLDKPGANPIAVMPIPEIGLGVAINARLRRAAANG